VKRCGSTPGRPVRDVRSRSAIASASGPAPTWIALAHARSRSCLGDVRAWHGSALGPSRATCSTWSSLPPAARRPGERLTYKRESLYAAGERRASYVRGADRVPVRASVILDHVQRWTAAPIAHDGPASRWRPSSATNAASATRSLALVRTGQAATAERRGRHGADQHGAGLRRDHSTPATGAPSRRRSRRRPGPGDSELLALAGAPGRPWRPLPRTRGTRRPGRAAAGASLGVDLVEVTAHALHRRPSWARPGPAAGELLALAGASRSRRAG